MRVADEGSYVPSGSRESVRSIEKRELVAFSQKRREKTKDDGDGPEDAESKTIFHL